ncbi:twin-arginine translocation signal domain-containing protein [Methylobacterium sp. CCH5-D2]|uniref:twin-arginine translocation signal domain-containing protein n=1 Tax=Methylobacterium sp. CCH5-D2 TaxID=1768765 RepID=UPI00082CA00E|nr:twin-arginine translocation signal domain-containing protein [Methylobacterium sp. CCH5-D2]
MRLSRRSFLGSVFATAGAAAVGLPVIRPQVWTGPTLYRVGTGPGEIASIKAALDAIQKNPPPRGEVATIVLPVMEFEPLRGLALAA